MPPKGMNKSSSRTSVSESILPQQFQMEAEQFTKLLLNSLSNEEISNKLAHIVSEGVVAKMEQLERANKQLTERIDSGIPDG